MLGAMEVLNRLNSYDHQLFARLFKQRNSAMVVALSRALSRSGEGVLHLLVILVAWLMYIPGREQLTALLLMSFALERCLHWLLKNTLKRPRPEHSFAGLRRLGHASNQFSFPSGHSSRAFLLATVMLIVFGSAMPALIPVLYAWAAAVALSRVVLGVHFPGDVLAGAIVGSGTALLCALLLQLP